MNEEEAMKEATDALLERIKELVRKEAKLNECVKAMGEFCDRVVKGEVRSTYTYAKFMKILDSLEES